MGQLAKSIQRKLKWTALGVLKYKRIVQRENSPNLSTFALGIRVEIQQMRQNNLRRLPLMTSTVSLKTNKGNLLFQTDSFLSEPSWFTPIIISRSWFFQSGFYWNFLCCVPVCEVRTIASKQQAYLQSPLKTKFFVFDCGLAGGAPQEGSHLNRNARGTVHKWELEGCQQERPEDVKIHFPLLRPKLPVG